MLVENDLKLDKRAVQFSFGNAAHHYHQYALLQRQVADVLFDRFSAGFTGQGSILDIGCGTGYFTEKILPLSSTVLAMDVAMPMLTTAREGLGAKPGLFYFSGDAEVLPLRSGSLDAIVSNLALQWCQNLWAVFTQAYRILKTEGQLCFSTFGETTLSELRAAWASVDNYSHVNLFTSKERIGNLLVTAGFTNIEITTTRYQPHYPDVIALMRELKGVGAHNVNQGRPRGLTGKQQLQAVISAYARLASQVEDVSATFEVINVTAWKSSLRLRHRG